MRRCFMWKWLILLAVCVLTAIFVCVPSIAQAQPGDPRPTFLDPKPGLYVNGWPAFTVSYPEGWVEQPLLPGEIFRAAALRPPLPPLPVLTVATFGNPGDIAGSADFFAGLLGMIGFRDVKVLYNRPAKLKDGTPACEAELEYVVPTGTKANTFHFVTKKDGAWIWVNVSNDKGAIGDDLKSVSHSLTLMPGRDNPVAVPPDVQAFLDKWSSDIDSHDLARIMGNYSEQYLGSRSNKAQVEGWFRAAPESPIQLGVTSASVTVTMFEPRGDKAYLAGFMGGKDRNGSSRATPPINDNQIVKENGQWKWYGNQK
jgi:hypothetical protein